jgi:hypothetical protein
VRSSVLARDPARLGDLISEARIAVIGWATVDWERAARELEVRIGIPPGAKWVPRPRDPELGAAVWVLDRARARGEPELALLEPDTEGRLAATLARHGEGVAALYLRGAPGPRVQDPEVVALDRLRLSGPADGPFGPQRLVLGGPVGGHSIVLLG